ncbi:MAG: MGMT family protein [Candidatus Bathyarchaeia archaeon]|jgi:O-6-methylguanine DNA methyltransferase
MIEVYSQNLDGVWFGVAYAKQQIIASSFSTSEQQTLGNMLTIIPYNTPFQVFHEPSGFAKDILASLKEIYDGENVNATFPLAYSHLPAYTQKVLKATLQVPLGYVTSYGSIAKAIGGSPRAVGNVMASNPFAPIVPCHRVVKSDFTLGGYGGGLKVKVEFLRREKKGSSTSKQIPVNGRNLTVFPVECVLGNLV